MKKILFLIALLPILLNACDKDVLRDSEESAQPADAQNIEQKKCEESGGKWDFFMCNMPGCQPEYFCNCLIEEEENTENELFKRDSIFRIEQNNVCVACEQDSDCGENTCEVVGGECRQNSAICEKGICHTKKYRSDWNETIFYGCVNNECQIKNEIIGYIADIRSDKMEYSQGENVIARVKLKNLSSSSREFEITAGIKELFGEEMTASNSSRQKIDANSEKLIEINIPTENIEIDDGHFEIIVTIPGVGSSSMREMIRIKPEQNITIESLDVAENFSKGVDPFAVFEVEIKNPTDKSLRAFVNFNIQSGPSSVAERPQIFVNLEPNETKKLTDDWSLENTAPGYYSVQAVASVGDFETSDVKYFEITD